MIKGPNRGGVATADVTRQKVIRDLSRARLEFLVAASKTVQHHEGVF
jgi:hypothetical protein